MPGAVHGSSVGNTSGKRFGANSHDADDANFGVNASVEAVPEIDPAGMASVLALVTGAFGLFERRRRASIPASPGIRSGAPIVAADRNPESGGPAATLP